jgi:putative transposase
MLPDSFPPWSTVSSRFRRWRLDGTLRRAHEVLRALVRQRAGRAPAATAAVIDSQSAKTAGVGGPARGYDGGKRVKGRKRHVLVDVMGLVLAVCVHAADMQDRHGARQLVEERPTRTFRVLPRRWAVERTFAWLGQARRLSKDYERLPATSEAMIYGAMCRLMLRRLAHPAA